jgi:hypothetical protein
MKRTQALLALILACACGRSGDVPLTMVLGESTRAEGAPAPRNVGTQVLLVPVPAGDLIKLAQQPELWPNTQQRVDVVSLYVLHAYYHDGYVCGEHCGPNTYQNLMNAVPGGVFRWVSDRFILSIESESVKYYACTEDAMRNSAAFTTNIAIDNIERSGARLSFVSLDEPFTSGTASATPDPLGGGNRGCGLTPAEVANLQRVYNAAVHARHPNVQIGLVEPYPHFKLDDLRSFVLELEQAGVPIPYFHLDVDIRAIVEQHHDAATELPQIREFFRSKDIPFGIIVFGADGTSNEKFSAGAWAQLRLDASTVGVTEHTVFQSWANSNMSDPLSPQRIPDTVPETNPFTHTGMILPMLDYLGIAPTQ